MKKLLLISACLLSLGSAHAESKGVIQEVGNWYFESTYIRDRLDGCYFSAVNDEAKIVFFWSNQSPVGKVTLSIRSDLIKKDEPYVVAFSDKHLEFTQDEDKIDYSNNFPMISTVIYADVAIKLLNNWSSGDISSPYIIKKGYIMNGHDISFGSKGFDPLKNLTVSCLSTLIDPKGAN
ncbi:hypothetical protein [Gluconobacter sp. OJB]|uniref:hypothetical protein n=1 Tax=Gluconobacter sp. OJB TaxID=3145196 RepID=UPI0031F9C237